MLLERCFFSCVVWLLMMQFVCLSVVLSLLTVRGIFNRSGFVFQLKVVCVRVGVCVCACVWNIMTTHLWGSSLIERDWDTDKSLSHLLQYLSVIDLFYTEVSTGSETDRHTHTDTRTQRHTDRPTDRQFSHLSSFYLFMCIFWCFGVRDAFNWNCRCRVLDLQCFHSFTKWTQRRMITFNHYNTSNLPLYKHSHDRNDQWQSWHN